MRRSRVMIGKISTKIRIYYNREEDSVELLERGVWTAGSSYFFKKH